MLWVRAARGFPGSFWAQRVAVAAAALTGARAEARRMGRQLMRKDPDLTVAVARQAWPFTPALWAALPTASRVPSASSLIFFRRRRSSAMGLPTACPTSTFALPVGSPKAAGRLRPYSVGDRRPERAHPRRWRCLMLRSKQDVRSGRGSGCLGLLRTSPGPRIVTHARTLHTDEHAYLVSSMVTGIELAEGGSAKKPRQRLSGVVPAHLLDAAFGRHFIRSARRPSQLMCSAPQRQELWPT